MSYLYLREEPGLGCCGLGQPPPGMSDATKTLEAIAKIRAQLNRNIRADDEPAYLDRRRRLREIFDSVPKLFAPSLWQRLTDRNDELGKLFHYRLATPTRKEMLMILLNKSSEPT